jgi:protein-S-isoprenylcysteine O-methyltransferase Ste14
MMPDMRIFIRWADRQTSLWQRIAILAIGALLFLLLMPLFLVLVLAEADGPLGWGGIFSGRACFIIGAILTVVGGITGVWTVAVQFMRGSGTPFPMVPTKRLISTGPYAMCRNPMALGTISAYLGISLMIGSVTSVIVIAVLSLLLLLYIKVIEEKELELRFGEEYVRYRMTTPFILPRGRTGRTNR